MIVLVFCCLYSEQIQFEYKAMKKILATSILVLFGGFAASAYAAKDFLNVSYDPTREFYQEYNQPLDSIGKAKLGRRSILSSLMVDRASKHVPLQRVYKQMW